MAIGADTMGHGGTCPPISQMAGPREAPWAEEHQTRNSKILPIVIGQNVDIYRWHLDIKTQKYRYVTDLKNDNDPALVSLHAIFITSNLHIYEPKLSEIAFIRS